MKLRSARVSTMQGACVKRNEARPGKQARTASPRPAHAGQRPPNRQAAARRPPQWWRPPCQTAALPARQARRPQVADIRPSAAAARCGPSRPRAAATHGAMCYPTELSTAHRRRRARNLRRQEPRRTAKCSVRLPGVAAASAQPMPMPGRCEGLHLRPPTRSGGAPLKSPTAASSQNEGGTTRRFQLSPSIESAFANRAVCSVARTGAME